MPPLPRPHARTAPPKPPVDWWLKRGFGANIWHTRSNGHSNNSYSTVISLDFSLASFVSSSASLLRSVSQLTLANNAFVPPSEVLYFILEFFIAPRQSPCNNIFAFRQIREGRKKDGLAYLEFVSRHGTSAQRNSAAESYHF